MPTISEQLGRFAAQTPPGALPDGVAHQGRRALVNFVGCAYGGSDDPSVRLALAALGPFAGAPEALVVGTEQRVDILLATLLNATAASAHAFDDTHFATVAHPTAPVAAALIALAQHRPLSGAQLLAALVLGIEVQCRVGAMLCTAPAECSVGLSMAGLVGGVGAAVAVGKGLGLDAAQLAVAIGLAANQAAGLRENHATFAHAATPGHAARCGIEAAFLARAGMTCSSRSLEGAKGFAAAFASHPQPAAALAGLGTRWETDALAYKPYPNGFVIHPVIDACLLLAAEAPIEPEAVAAIELTVSPLLLALTDRPAPEDRLQAVTSAQHWAAITLIRGVAGLEEASDAAVRDPAVTALRRRVRLLPDARIGREQAEVALRLRDGRVCHARVECCRGSVLRPLSDDEIGAKFLAQAGLHLPPPEAARRLALAWRLPDCEQVGALVPDLLGPAPRTLRSGRERE